jgi:pyruvate/2-oxoglutarate dehydrogenase complex dihydrolipoamide acyltransferase (E2) component
MEPVPATSEGDEVDAQIVGAGGSELGWRPGVRAHVFGSYERHPEATKAAKERADELGVDLANVTGTGLNGRITVGDVEDASG